MNEYNDTGEKHGYWEEDDEYGVINLSKGYYNNGIMEGPWEFYTEWGILFKGNYKYGEYYGSCMWYKEGGEVEKEFYL